MKVLLVSATFPPRQFGGMTASSHMLAKHLVKRGHKVTVYTTDIRDRQSRIPKAGGIKKVDRIEVHYFRNISNWLASQRLYSPLGMIAALRQELSNFDVIHLNEYRSFPSIIVHYYAKKYNIPYVLQAHGSLARVMSKQRLKKIFDLIWGYRLLQDAAKLIALTPMEAEQYQSFSVDKAKIETVPNGIDLAEFEKLPPRGKFRRKYGVAPDQKMVLFLARLHKIKGPDLLVRAFASIVPRLKDAKLVIVGPDEGYLPALKKLVKELDIESNIHFIGPLYGKEKLEAYVDADVYVLPSVYETFPVAAIEASACGTPVILTEYCGAAGMIDGQAGLVVSYDKDQLSDAILRMLSNEEMRQKFAERGKALVREKFNWAKIAEQVERIYLDCISQE